VRLGPAENPYVSCGRCQFFKYDNTIPTTIGIVKRDDTYLFLRRAHDPYRGRWDTVGGFLGPGERAEDCLAREAHYRCRGGRCTWMIQITHSVLVGSTLDRPNQRFSQSETAVGCQSDNVRPEASYVPRCPMHTAGLVRTVAPSSTTITS
jgi:hypothetical protein